MTIDTAKIAAALALVKYKTIVSDKSVKVALKNGGTYTFNYAPLENILSAIRGPLAEQGLSLTQSVTPDGRMLLTRLLHNSGESIESYTPLALREGMSAQEMGSALSYARRYGVTLVCCLVSDEDDDANIADGNSITPMKPARKPAPPTPGTTPTLESWTALTDDQKRDLWTTLSEEQKGTVRTLMDESKRKEVTTKGLAAVKDAMRPKPQAVPEIAPETPHTPPSPLNEALAAIAKGDYDTAADLSRSLPSKDQQLVNEQIRTSMNFMGGAVS